MPEAVLQEICTAYHSNPGYRQRADSQSGLLCEEGGVCLTVICLSGEEEEEEEEDIEEEGANGNASRYF